jgi:hypothetical protein
MDSGKEYCVYSTSETFDELIEKLLPKQINETKLNVLELVTPINNHNAIVINGAHISEILCSANFKK